MPDLMQITFGGVTGLVPNCPDCHHTNSPTCTICPKPCFICLIRGNPIAGGTETATVAPTNDPPPTTYEDP